MNVFAQQFHHEQDVIQCQFLSKIALVLIQSFSSPKLVGVILFFYGWEWGNRLINAFHKGIIRKWNANSLVQDLNSGCRFYFLR